MKDAHQRISPRLQAFDYARPGAYFVTICTHERRRLLGRVSGIAVLLSEEGRIVEEEWLGTAEKRPYVTLDSHVTMPNHVHGLIVIQEHATPVSLPSNGPKRHSLSSILGSFKAAASRRIANLVHGQGPTLWQRGYYEHVVRNEDDLRSIRRYIADNPARWCQP